MKRINCLLAVIALSTVLVACGDKGIIGETINQSSSVEAKNTKGSRDASVKVLVPKASGSEVYGNSEVSIDASNSSDGYVMVSYSGDSKKVRMLIETPAGNKYNYLMDLDGQYDVYPLSEGDGNYKIGVYENLHDDQYTAAFTQTISAKISNPLSPFLYPNAYVNFNSNSKAVAKGKELAAGCNNDLEVVENVYHFISKNITYDYDKAATVQSGYVPTVDETLATKKGICFDYSSLMGAMLRSQGIPTRLEIGYAGTEYHAWISVYTKETGWIDGVIEFDGNDWALMDPTLASYANKKTVKEHVQSNSYYQLYYKY